MVTWLFRLCCYSKLCNKTYFKSFVGKRRVFMSAAENINRSGGQDSLKAFVVRAKTASTDRFRRFKKVHVVTGNEACDLDSAVSAIAFAYFKSKVTASSDTVHVPLLNIPREDFPLRSDLKHVLSSHDIDDSLLTFRSDVDLHDLQRQERLSLSVVDFHIFPKKDESLEDSLVEIIDHHKQEKNFCQAIHAEIKMVGSCSTLVAARLFRENFEMPSSLVKLLYSAIIMDTICMSDTAGKKTEDDERIVTKLEDLEPSLAKKRQKIFDDIHKARTDVSGLTNLELLRKDLKIISSNEMPQFLVTMSTIEEGFQVFLARAGVLKSLEDFAQQHKASAAVLMFLSIESSKQLTRQLAVCSPHARLREEICRVLMDAKDPDLILSEISPTSWDSSQINIYDQGNVKASRKAVLPILKNNLNKLSEFYNS